MERPLVIARCEVGPDLARQLRSWEDDGVAVEIVPESDDVRFHGLLLRAVAILHLLKPIGPEVFQAAPRLRLVQKIGVGVNTIALEAARRRGVAVCNMPGTNTAAVAEMTLALMLAALRRLPLLERAARAEGGWLLPAGSEAVLGEICGRSIGLVGAGAVPQRLAPILALLGAKVLYWNRRPKPEMAAAWTEWPELLRKADIVSLHLPLTAETECMLNRAAFERMKPGTIMVNTARGGLVDEAALVEALDTGQLAFAALDVLATEPPAPDHPLLGRQDVLIAPHVAWLTAETWQRSLGIARENVLRALRGEPLLHRVVEAASPASGEGVGGEPFSRLVSAAR